MKNFFGNKILITMSDFEFHKDVRLLDTENSIPDTLTNLLILYCKNNSKVSYIPETLTKLQKIDCHNSPISKIPNTFIKLEELFCYSTHIKEIPSKLMN